MLDFLESTLTLAIAKGRTGRNMYGRGGGRRIKDEEEEGDF